MNHAIRFRLTAARTGAQWRALIREVAMLLRQLRSWLTMADYYEEMENATKQIATRYSRGNVSMQNGRYIDSDNLRELSLAGDRALARLKKRLPADFHGAIR